MLTLEKVLFHTECKLNFLDNKRRNRKHSRENSWSILLQLIQDLLAYRVQRIMLLLTDFLSRFSLESGSSSLWWFVVVSAGFAFLANFVVSFVQQRKMAAWSVLGVPGPEGHWLKGHLDYAKFDGDGLKFHVKCATEFKTCYGLWFGPLKSLVVLCHPETIKVIQSSNAPKERFVYNLVRPFIGELICLVTSLVYRTSSLSKSWNFSWSLSTPRTLSSHWRRSLLFYLGLRSLRLSTITAFDIGGIKCFTSWSLWESRNTPSRFMQGKPKRSADLIVHYRLERRGLLLLQDALQILQVLNCSSFVSQGMVW